MTAALRSRFRRLFFNLHLWLGIVLMVLLIPIGLSGSLLVWHDGLEELLYPSRFSGTGDATLPPSTYLAAGAEAIGARGVVASLRYPAEAGAPVQVNGRIPGEGRTGFVTAYLDPATAKVLDTSDSRTSFVRLMHNLHGNLLVPELSGRQIVGWAGVVLTFSALSGLYLWWPKRGFLKALGWRKGPKPSYNLHLMIGAWTAIPLAVIAFTGVWISFPQTARQSVAVFAEVPAQRAPQNRGAMFSAKPVENPVSSADAILKAALDAAPGQAISAINLPTDQSAAWRVQFRAAEGPGRTVLVDDATGRAARQDRPQREARGPAPGDPAQTAAQFMRRLHDGGGYPLIWQIVVFVTGLLPALFGITGLIMYLRRRRNRRLLEARMQAARQAAAASPAAASPAA